MTGATDATNEPQAGVQGLDGVRRIDCAEQCEIPEGVRLAEVPRPRHAWGDALNCPNDGCERSFLVTPAGGSDG